MEGCPSTTGDSKMHRYQDENPREQTEEDYEDFFVQRGDLQKEKKKRRGKKRRSSSVSNILNRCLDDSKSNATNSFSLSKCLIGIWG